MAKLFSAIGALPNFPPRYNAAPSQALPIVRRGGRGGRELALARWGLVPSWSKGPDARFSMINARAETVAEKPAYRGAFRHRPCLVPADGFYEWQARGKGVKQPYYFSLPSGKTFAFAGLWEHWLGAGGDEIESFTIIVTDANACVQPVHERMPVILRPEDYPCWLGEEDAPARARLALLKPFPADEMRSWPVSRQVNSPANDSPELIAVTEPS
jgi:putative SOS response-associated peptidase YedK